ncbi:orotidine-5'-phosphate decarboxylase [Bowmanella sp. JS7-9]|uniref:Orotidine 5'-phosphate decarboxylase n=1 Tax=Pseudobowmanella zhangzhouensis TaxID=1537679 RepID=A0ABW1XJP2_9ALTE|nr:orotidine-5'-phosphate decarboxylase [Bowmanella sp. JS7-9]TBX27501.1 orotidine 5'-phosphate decarboxylase [Bowmanella sp. JS7-9]
MQDPKVIVALDFDKEHDALQFVERVSPSDCRLKVGKEMFTYLGPQFVKSLINKGFDVFLDLKFHDIPNTVAKACVAAADMGVWMVNVHASGGRKMMETTRTELASFGANAPKLIAVTVLTSMSETELRETGVPRSPEQQVLHLATLAQQSGMDGVVCSAQEAAMLKQTLGHAFQLVTPGIRPVGAELGDQMRVMTPEQAMLAGVDYMVIGRPITKASDPVAVLNEINRSISS